MRIRSLLNLALVATAFLALFCLPAIALPSLTTLTKIRITTKSDCTRFVFDLSNPINYHLIYTPNSQQLVLNLSKAKLASSLPKTKLTTTPVQDYQAKATASDAFCLDFNLKTAVIPKIYTLAPSGAYGNRLVLDLRPVQHTPATVAAPLKTPAAIPADVLPDSVKPQTKPSILRRTKSKKNRPVVIVVDAGHGGKDPGAVGSKGIKEKNVVLAISKLVQQILANDPAYRVQLTRSQDVFIPLRQRLAIARRYKPDLFIAVHADAAYSDDANGASVFALSERGATSEIARWLAQKENQSELVDGVFVQKDQVLRSVLLDLSQAHSISVSLEMGQAILQQLSTITHLHYARVEQAAFIVLKSPDIPSLLIETGYVSNPQQEKQLLNPAYQRQIALAIVQGVKNYFSRYPPDA